MWKEFEGWPGIIDDPQLHDAEQIGYTGNAFGYRANDKWNQAYTTPSRKIT